MLQETKQQMAKRGNRMQSRNFWPSDPDLGLMYDALESQNLQLQIHSIPLWVHSSTTSEVLYLTAGVKRLSRKAMKAQTSGLFGSLSLGVKCKSYTSQCKALPTKTWSTTWISDSPFEGKTLCDLSILDTSDWLSTPGTQHGESQVKRPSRRFNLCEDHTVNVTRDFLERLHSQPESLKPLIWYM